MDDPTDPLGEPCPECGVPLGDHTVREWTAHAATPTLDLPAEEIPEGPIWGTVGDMPAADHLTVMSAVLDGGPVGPLAGLQFNFAVGRLGAAPLPYPPMLFVGSAEGTRKIGKVIRDLSNQAANRAEAAAQEIWPKGTRDGRHG